VRGRPEGGAQGDGRNPETDDFHKREWGSVGLKTRIFKRFRARLSMRAARAVVASPGDDKYTNAPPGAPKPGSRYLKRFRVGRAGAIFTAAGAEDAQRS
jgi:hypothetical protein